MLIKLKFQKIVKMAPLFTSETDMTSTSIKVLPTLFGRSKTGKVKCWEIKVTFVDYNTSVITIKHGYIDGAMQSTSTTIRSGKNFGKANYTTPHEQALREAKSKWMKQFDKGYRETVEELNDLPILPMLAQNYRDQKSMVIWPQYGQPKLNGVRCVATIKDGLVSFMSRNGKTYETLDHIAVELVKIFGNGPLQLDGEIYHLDLTLQQILKRVKRVKGDRSDITDSSLQYWIYDIIDQDKPFQHRYNFLTQKPLIQTNFLKPVETVLLYSESDLIKFDNETRALGFEGSMLRKPSGLYIPNYRSADLLKYKEGTFKEEDYEVVNGVSAKGKDEGSVVFICKLPTGEEFSVRPKGTLEYRKFLLKNINQYIGRKLTVRYAELTADGIPFHPVGLFFRDQYE